MKKLEPVKKFERRRAALVGQAIALAMGNSEVIVIAPSEVVSITAGQLLGCREPDANRMRQVAILDAKVHAALADDATGLIRRVAQLINGAGTTLEPEALRNLKEAYGKFQSAEMASIA